MANEHYIVTTARDRNCLCPTPGINQIEYQITDMPNEKAAITKAEILALFSLTQCWRCVRGGEEEEGKKSVCNFRPMAFSVELIKTT